MPRRMEMAARSCVETWVKHTPLADIAQVCRGVSLHKREALALLLPAIKSAGEADVNLLVDTMQHLSSDGGQQGDQPPAPQPVGVIAYRLAFMAELLATVPSVCHTHEALLQECVAQARDQMGISRPQWVNKPEWGDEVPKEEKLRRAVSRTEWKDIRAGAMALLVNYAKATRDYAATQDPLPQPMRVHLTRLHKEHVERTVELADLRLSGEEWMSLLRRLAVAIDLPNAQAMLLRMAPRAEAALQAVPGEADKKREERLQRAVEMLEFCALLVRTVGRMGPVPPLLDLSTQPPAPAPAPVMPHVGEAVRSLFIRVCSHEISSTSTADSEAGVLKAGIGFVGAALDSLPTWTEWHKQGYYQVIRKALVAHEKEQTDVVQAGLAAIERLRQGVRSEAEGFLRNDLYATVLALIDVITTDTQEGSPKGLEQLLGSSVHDMVVKGEGLWGRMPRQQQEKLRAYCAALAPEEGWRWDWGEIERREDQAGEEAREVDEEGEDEDEDDEVNEMDVSDD